MNTASIHATRLSRGATLLAALVIAVLGLAVLSATANAAFTLNSGTLSLTDGNGTTDPPDGSWVELPEDPPATGFFNNKTSSWGGTPAGKYTLIKNADSVLGTTALTLGSAQPGGGIFGDTTDPFNGIPFTAVTTKAPKLVFHGSATDAGTRTLKWGSLKGLEILYGGGTYDVSTTSKPGGKHIVPLAGEITGDATDPLNPATVRIEWTSDLVEPGFSPFEAHFQWEGEYTP